MIFMNKNQANGATTLVKNYIWIVLKEIVARVDKLTININTIFYISLKGDSSWVIFIQLKINIMEIH